MPHLKITGMVLVHCNIVNTDYQQDSRFLYRFVPKNSFGQLIDSSPKKFIFLKPFNSEFSYIEVWFTDQNGKPLQIEGKINITLVVRRTTDALKTFLKRVIQKTAEAAGDLISNKIANKITKVSKISQQNNSETVTNEHDEEMPKKICISRWKKRNHW